MSKANEELREQEERIRLAFEAARMVSWDWEIQSERVILSHGWETLHGIPSGSFAGTFGAYLSDIHPEDREAVLGSIGKAVEQRTEHHAEYRIMWPDGSVHRVEARGRVLCDSSGKPERMIGICMDIQRRKQIETENARLYAEVKDADRRKDEFLAMLAHELRNPLAPIRTGLDLLAMKGSDGTVELMREQLRYLVRLVDDLLDVSRILRGRIQVRKEKVRLGDIVQLSLDATRSQIEKQKHELTVSLPSSAIWLDADSVRMAQVIINLLNNAAKYTPRGGHIRLTAKQENGQAIISVEDNGMGIDTALLPHIFELFTQGKQSLDRSVGGLGIGLTLVKNLVEMHGGIVEAHSEGSGKGSQFVIRMPIPCQLPEENTLGPQAQVVLSRRVLIVEDNPAAASMLAAMLKIIGQHKVQVAGDGETGLKLAKEFHPEVVLLDIGLPGIDGYEVAKRLREEPEGNCPLAGCGHGIRLGGRPPTLPRSRL